MEKLRLDLDDVVVESFATDVDALRGDNGTVEAFITGTDPRCTRFIGPCTPRADGL